MPRQADASLTNEAPVTAGRFIRLSSHAHHGFQGRLVQASPHSHRPQFQAARYQVTHSLCHRSGVVVSVRNLVRLHTADRKIFTAISASHFKLGLSTPCLEGRAPGRAHPETAQLFDGIYAVCRLLLLSPLLWLWPRQPLHRQTLTSSTLPCNSSASRVSTTTMLPATAA